jgi:Mg2+ and Co2+ transporter CorA
MGNPKMRKTIFIWFFLFFISIIFLCSQAAAQDSQKSRNTGKEISKEELVAELLKQMGTYTDRVNITIMILSAIVFLVSISAPIIIWLMERKTRRDSKEMEERLQSKFQNEIMQRIISQLQDQIKNYEAILIEHLDYEVDPIEKRLMKEEKVRSDIWGLLFSRMSEALEKNKPAEYLKGWADFHKLQIALSQLLSKDPTDICTGLGTFISLHEEGLVPVSLWDLILLLKEQNRIKGLTTRPIVEKLGSYMKRNLSEEPERTAYG